MSGRAARQTLPPARHRLPGRALLYVAFAALASIFPDVEQVEGARFWPAFLPDWPIDLLLALAAVLLVGDALLWLVARSAARASAAPAEALASDWPFRADAKMAAAEGRPGPQADVVPRPAAARRRAPRRGPHRRAPTTASSCCARARQLRPVARHLGQAPVRRLRGRRDGLRRPGSRPPSACTSTRRSPRRAAPGSGRRPTSGWSPPAWASVTTPPARLRDVSLRHLWTLAAERGHAAAGTDRSRGGPGRQSRGDRLH